MQQSALWDTYLKMKQLPKRKKKQLIIAVICLFLFFLIIFLGLWIWSLCKPVTAAQMNLADDNYIAVQKDGRYGYIDMNGTLQIDYQYFHADDFYGEYAKVERENDCALINRKGTILFTAQDCNNITYYTDAARWVINGKLYDYDMNPIRRNWESVAYQHENLFTFFNPDEKKFGLMNAEGEVLYAMSSDTVSFYQVDVGSTDPSFVGTYGVLQVNQEYMLFHVLTGKVIMQFTDMPIVSLGNNIFEVETDEGTYAIYVEENRIAYQTEIGETLSFYNVPERILRIDGATTRYYDLDEQVYLDSVTGISEQYASSEFEAKTSYHMTHDNGKYGLLSGTYRQKMILPCRYDQIIYLNHTLYDYIHDQTGKNLIFLVDGENLILYDLAHHSSVFKVQSSADVVTSPNSTFVLISGSEESILYNFLTNQKMNVEEEVEIHRNYVQIGNTLYNVSLNSIYSYE